MNIEPYIINILKFLILIQLYFKINLQL